VKWDEKYYESVYQKQKPFLGVSSFGNLAWKIGHIVIGRLKSQY
jgi:hypothetical protein